MASEHCRWTSDFLSYWPGLDSRISTIAENQKKRKTNDVTDNLNEEDVNVHIHTIIIQKKSKYLNFKIRTSDFSSRPVDFSVTGPDGPVATNS